jgi:outer membrane protein
MKAALVRVAAGFAASLLLALAPARAETIALNEALGLAYETNPQLEAERANLRATDENVAKALSGWRPTVTGTGEYGYQRQTTTGAPPSVTETTRPRLGQVTIVQPIFSGGRTIANTGQAKALVRAGRAQLTGVEQNVLLDAVTAYMNVVADQATVQLNQNNVQVLQEQLQAAEVQFKVGAGTRTDVAQSQARLSGAQAALTTSEGQLAAERSTFEHVIGRAPEELEKEPAFPVLPDSQEKALDLALQNNPQLVAAREQATAADYAVDAAVGTMLPSVAVQGQYQTQSNVFGAGVQNNTVSVLGTVTVPIYQAGEEEAGVRQAKELRSQATLQIADAERQVRESVRTAWETLQSAKAAVTSNIEQVKANQVAYEGVVAEHSVGARTTIEVLNAEQELLAAQVALVDTKRDAYVASYQLLAAAGALTAKALSLQVKLYDPQVHYDEDSGRWFGLGD